MQQFKYVLLNFEDKKKNDFKIHTIDIDPKLSYDNIVAKIIEIFDDLEYGPSDCFYNPETKKLVPNDDYNTNNIIFSEIYGTKDLDIFDGKCIYFDNIYAFIKEAPKYRGPLGHKVKAWDDWSDEEY